MSEIEKLRLLVKEVYARSHGEEFTLKVDSSLTGEKLEAVEGRLMRSLETIANAPNSPQAFAKFYAEPEFFLSLMRRSYVFLYLLYGEEDAYLMLRYGTMEVWSIVIWLLTDDSTGIRGDISGWSSQRIVMLYLSQYVPTPQVVETLVDPLAREELSILNKLLDKYLDKPFARA